jgi:transposase
VHLLSKQGVSIHAIARQLKICRQAVRRYLQAEEFPEIAPPPPQGNILDLYKPYIFQWWQQGCRNSVQLYDEIKAGGYSGCNSRLRNFLASVRKKHREAGSLAQQFVLMLAEHRAEDLDVWLVQAEQSGLPELRKMAKGIR